MYVCMYVFMIVCMYVCMYDCMYLLLLYLRMYCMYACMYIRTRALVSHLKILSFCISHCSSLGITIYFRYQYLLVICRFTGKQLDIPMEWVLYSKKNVYVWTIGFSI